MYKFCVINDWVKCRIYYEQKLQCQQSHEFIVVFCQYSLFSAYLNMQKINMSPGKILLHPGEGKNQERTFYIS